jgi:5-methylcytosine-specific restriction endonuclease McrA
VDGIIENALEKLNRQYSEYGGIFDYDPNGSKEESNIPWETAKTIVLMRDGYRCRVCGKSPLIMENEDGYSKLRLEVEVHHIIPRVAGGSDSTKNLITLCKSCHIKTFKNEYSGIPLLANNLTDRVEILTNSKILKNKGSNCSDYQITSFYFGSKEIIEKDPIICSSCYYSSLSRVYDVIFNYGLDVEEIVTKNKKNEFCLGILERYSP